MRAAFWPRPQGNPEAQIVVVVCREGNRHVGIAVSHVLDVAAGSSLFEAGTEPADRRRHAAQESRDGRSRSGRGGAAAGARKARLRIGSQMRRQWHESIGNRIARKQKAEALVEVCSVRLGKTLFGVPITHILEIVGAARPQPVPLAPAYVGGLVHYRGDVLTTVSLRQLLAPSAARGRAGHSRAGKRRGDVSGCWWTRWARC